MSAAHPQAQARPHAQAHPYCNPDVLVRLVQGGSPDAVDRVTRCYGQRLLAAGQRHCRTATEAEDAVQDTLLLLTTRIHDYRGEGSLEGWLVRIVASACRRMSRGVRNDASRHDSAHVAASAAPLPDDLACRSELGQALQAALLALPRRDRLVALLAEVEGWTAIEIAGELGTTPGAVRTRLSRIRARLRAALLPLLDDESL